MNARMMPFGLAVLLCCGCGGGNSHADPGVSGDEEVAEVEEEETGEDQGQDQGQIQDQGQVQDQAQDQEQDSGTVDSNPADPGTPETAQPGGAVGAPCSKASDCDGGESAACLDLPGGYCMLTGCSAGSCPAGSSCFDFQDNTTACVKTCTKSSECRLTEGYVCDADGTCWESSTPTGTVPIGGPCATNDDCKDDGASCYPEVAGATVPTGFTGGYCLKFGCSASKPCPAGATCSKMTDGTKACLADCTTSDDCRKTAGYACKDQVCRPACAGTADCPAKHQCSTGDAFCIPDTLACAPSNLSGYCAKPLVCQAGKCQTFDFQCKDEQFEPNETVSEAKAPEVGWNEGLQLCEDDTDWYRATAPDGTLATLGVEFNQTVGDLDLLAYDPVQKFLGSRMGTETWDYREYETGTEYLSVLSAGGEPQTWFFKVRGYKGAFNDYRLTWTTAPWKDGAKCVDADFGDSGECIGLPGGKMKLYEFPFPDPKDPYLGAGYMFDAYSNYRWLRRETIMAIRYCIHAVQEKFSDTKPLGLVEMCQIDGITPGYDIGDPHHPQSTHDQGGNIDVAYYQTGPDNHARIVCDGKGGSNDGYFCTSVANHIVDLPRTAYFMMTLVQNPRFRVAGNDKLIAPLVLAEAKKQVEAGWFAQSTYNALVNKLAYGSGWEFHHHHIHISMQWWTGYGAADAPNTPLPGGGKRFTGCGYRMPGDGALQGLR